MAFDTDEPGEPLDDIHQTRNVAGRRRTGVSGVSTPFTLLAILLCTVSEIVLANKRTVGVKAEDLVDWDSNMVVRVEFDVVDTEGGCFAFEVLLGVV